MKNYFWFVCSLVWAGLILHLSFFTPISEGEEPWLENQDKLGHFIFYAVLSMFLIKTFSKEISIQYPMNSGALISLIFGVLIELGQHFFTNDRYGDFMDVLANGSGILLVVILIRIFPKYFRHKSIL
jgi:VanZ family protein